jgi:NAD(P)-dependent dehydrogenase (short-subunit alcohol dehydrogenase family)
MPLTGKRVVVIGGASGIGFAVAALSRESGAGVVIASSNAAKAATAYVYLMLNSYVTGQIVPVDGGGGLV